MLLTCCVHARGQGHVEQGAGVQRDKCAVSFLVVPGLFVCLFAWLQLVECWVLSSGPSCPEVWHVKQQENQHQCLRTLREHRGGPAKVWGEKLHGWEFLMLSYCLTATGVLINTSLGSYCGGITEWLTETQSKSIVGKFETLQRHHCFCPEPVHQVCPSCHDSWQAWLFSKGFHPLWPLRGWLKMCTLLVRNQIKT